MSWSSRVVAVLEDGKRSGMTFDRAWRVAMAAHPPSARDVGWRETLWPMDGAGEELSTVEWLHRSCEDAWFGRKPALRFLAAGIGLLEGAGDASRGARRRGSGQRGRLAA